jgi:hypothetical protein
VADGQSHSGIRELTKIILTGLFGAIIFGPIGYFINDYLSKDNINIEQVDFIPETNYFSLSKDKYNELIDDTGINKYGDFDMYDLLKMTAYEYRSFDDQLSFKMQNGLNEKDVDKLIEHIDVFMKNRIKTNELYDRYIKILQQYNDGDNIIDIVKYANIDFITKIYLDKHADAVPILLNSYNGWKEFLSKENIILSNFLNDMKNFKQKRTGFMKINIVLLNLGNTDGLVSRRGTLHLDDGTIIKIKIADEKNSKS